MARHSSRPGDWPTWWLARMAGSCKLAGMLVPEVAGLREVSAAVAKSVGVSRNEGYVAVSGDAEE